MKGTNLGEFEELVLLVVAVLYKDAYGVAIQDELKKRCGRSAALSTIHVVLHRLEEKGFLESKLEGATDTRGGRRKLVFCLTKSGARVLAESRDLRNSLWNAAPRAALSMK